MKKNLIIIVVSVFSFFLFAIFVYLLIDMNVENDIVAKLEKYNLKEEEKIIEEFTYDEINYKISMYHDDTSAWSHVNILTKNNNDFYILKNIKKCDTSEDASNIYIYNDTIYIHCIGKKGNILEYKLNKYKIEENVRYLNYNNTVNISQIHLTIDKVDDEYIYLSSIKIDNTLKDGNKVKCSLSNNICSYY